MLTRARTHLRIRSHSCVHNGYTRVEWLHRLVMDHHTVPLVNNAHVDGFAIHGKRKPRFRENMI